MHHFRHVFYSISTFFTSLLFILMLWGSVFGFIGCANIIPPDGGPKDTIPPRLILAIPKDSATNVTTNKFTLTFDEFVEVKDALQNVWVSPQPKNSPVIDYKLRNVFIKLKDSLEPNTTYSINFGTAIKDVNEGNPAKSLNYVFSTGSSIDRNIFKGKVILAETGKIDTTLIVLLHTNLNDTAILKNRAKYITRLNGMGEFSFNFLPKKEFAVYVLPNDYSKKYDDSTKLFAFANHPIQVSDTTHSIILYAYEATKKKVLEKPSTNLPATSTNTNSKEDKRLKYTTSLKDGKQDLLNDTMTLTFNRKLKKIDTSLIVVTDTNNIRLTQYTIVPDTLNKYNLYFITKWKENQALRVVTTKGAVIDTTGVSFLKNDTLNFSTKLNSDYGNLKIKFSHFKPTDSPILQILLGERIVAAIPITSNTITKNLFQPDTYNLRILFDTNGNGVWDAGNFSKKVQPEITFSLPDKLVVKPDWGNEMEITIPTIIQ